MAEKRTSTNQEFVDLGKRGEKGLDDIIVNVEFCTMPTELREKAILKIKELMGKYLFI